MTEEQILRLYREADAFLNVTGAQELREEHLACPRRIYVESDPFAVQVKVAQGDRRRSAALAAHDTHFSFGENLGAPDCDVPRRALPLAAHAPARGPRPVAATGSPSGRLGLHDDHHLAQQGQRHRLSTARRTTGRKDREFERSSDLPRRGRRAFELAAGTERRHVQRLLREHGWRHGRTRSRSRATSIATGATSSSRAASSPWRATSTSGPRTGWFSDRSACYLAAGRPVITQETGFSKFLPTGKGLFGFQTMEDILAAVDAIESDYAGNCRAAREIAAEYFAAEKVLGSLMARAGMR